jgi:hypothetical protein
MSGRQIKVRVEGDSSEELERAALDQARGFFPAGVEMGIADGYVAATMSPLMGTPPAHAYWAEITVGEAFTE